MGLTTLNILWLVPAFTLTSQDIVTLSVSSQATVTCGEQVTLQCTVSSKFPDDLQIKYLEWSQNKTTLCSVTSEGDITKNNRHASDFHCEYKNQQLSLVFHNTQPMERGHYRCKLQSNQGTSHRYAHLDLQECCGSAEGFLTSHGPSCTFKHVWPDGDVHWFHGSRHLSDGSVKHVTTKQAEKGGWLTIESHLVREGSDVPYNCSLKSTKSGRYIASALADTVASVRGSRGHASSSLHRDGVTAVTTLLSVSVLLPLTLK